jgi:hypothetical protein
MEPYAGFEPQVGEIRALRTFRIGPGGSLVPLFGSEAWHDASNTARCRVVQRPDAAVGPHEVPDPECSCGFYAYGNAAAVGEYPHTRHVLAVVACWGRVIAGTRGVRAEHCRVEALWLSERVPAELIGQLGNRYPSVTIYRPSIRSRCSIAMTRKNRSTIPGHDAGYQSPSSPSCWPARCPCTGGTSSRARG